MKIQILGISEHRWTGNGQYKIEGGEVIFYSGSSQHKHQHGVAIIVSEEVSKSVKTFIPLSDRVMLLQLKAIPVNINLLQVVAPTAEKSDEFIEEFYDQISEIMKLANQHDVNIIMGDFNAKIGKGKYGDCIGEHGLGTRNDRGERLVQYYQTYSTYHDI